MKGVTALVVAVALVALLTGVPLLLIQCPLLTANAKPVHNCCPSRRPEPAKCPVAPTLELCPYVLSEGKLGAPELAKSAAAVPVIAPQLDSDRPVFSAPATVAWQPPDSGLYIRIRVLRI